MVFSNVLPDVVLFLGLALGLILGFKLGFVKVLFSGFFKRVIALICAILLAKPVGRLIGEKFFFGGVADWIEKTLNKAIGEGGSASGEAMYDELPRVVRWIADLLHVDVSSGGTVREVSETVAAPVANFFGVVIAVIVLYIVFRFAFRLIRAILDRLMNLPVLVVVNKILGVVFGFAFAALFLWIILSIYAAVGAHYAGEPGFFLEFDLEKTLVAKYLSGTRPLDFVFSIK